MTTLIPLALGVIFGLLIACIVAVLITDKSDDIVKKPMFDAEFTPAQRRSKMITAKEARENYEKKLPKVKEREIKEELRRINEYIKYAIKHGEHETVANKLRHEETLQILEENGYKVEEGMLCYIIRW